MFGRESALTFPSSLGCRARDDGPCSGQDVLAIRVSSDQRLGGCSSLFSVFHRVRCNKQAVSRSRLSEDGVPQQGSHLPGEGFFTPHTMSSRQEARGREFAVWVTSQRTLSEKERTRKRFEETAKRTRNIRWLVTIDEKAKALANMRGTDVSELLAQLVREECARREEE